MEQVFFGAAVVAFGLGLVAEEDAHGVGALGETVEAFAEVAPIRGAESPEKMRRPSAAEVCKPRGELNLARLAL